MKVTQRDVCGSRRGDVLVHHEAPLKDGDDDVEGPEAFAPT